MHDPVYCDTDSIITLSDIPSSNELGEMKLEHKIEKMVIVKPKFYALKTENTNIIKIKGISTVILFNDVLSMKTMYKYQKFCKIRESLRRNLVPNQKIMVCKNISLVDNKREWKEDFDVDSLYESNPLCLA